MFTRQLVLVFAGGLLVPPAAESASPAPPVRVTARLYNTAQVPDVMKDAALRVATGALIAGGIDLRWTDCDLADSCGTAPARGELVIRLARSADQPSSGPRHQTPVVLGQALIDIRERTGVLATIFVDSVELIAALSEIDAALLLGRAIAHELGHLLLGTNAHSVHGLMRAQWTPADVRRPAIADWALTTEEAAAIRRRLQ
jgi:hypothetical protein